MSVRLVSHYPHPSQLTTDGRRVVEDAKGALLDEYNRALKKVHQGLAAPPAHQSVYQVWVFGTGWRVYFSHPARLLFPLHQHYQALLAEDGAGLQTALRGIEKDVVERYKRGEDGFFPSTSPPPPPPSGSSVR